VLPARGKRQPGPLVPDSTFAQADSLSITAKISPPWRPRRREGSESHEHPRSRPARPGPSAAPRGDFVLTLPAEGAPGAKGWRGRTRLGDAWHPAVSAALSEVPRGLKFL